MACPVCTAEDAAHETVLGTTEILRCRACTHRYAAQAQTVAYDALYNSGVYQKTLVLPTRASAASGEVLEQTHEPFFKRVFPFGQRRLLEVACGTGRFSSEASKRGWNIVACDPSQAAIAVAREAFGGLDFQVSEAVAAPLGPFEVVAALEFIEHLVNPLAALAAMALRTLSGGVIYLTVPNWGSRGVRQAVHPAWIPPIHLQFFTRRSLRLALRRVGRFNRTTIRLGFVPPIRSMFPLTQFYSNQPDGLWASARSA